MPIHLGNKLKGTQSFDVATVWLWYFSSLCAGSVLRFSHESSCQGYDSLTCAFASWVGGLGLILTIWKVLSPTSSYSLSVFFVRRHVSSDLLLIVQSAEPHAFCLWFYSCVAGVTDEFKYFWHKKRQGIKGEKERETDLVAFSVEISNGRQPDERQR